MNDECGTPVIRKTATGAAARKLRAQTSWYLNHQHQDCVPRVRGQKDDGDRFTLDPDYVADAVNLHEWMRQDDGGGADEALFIRILETITREFHEPEPLVAAPDVRDLYIQRKIFLKLQETAAASADLSALLGRAGVRVNGRTCLGFYEVMRRILSSEAHMAPLAIFRPTPLHGDLTMENILVNHRGFFFIDPNDENDLNSPLVDYAKLMQSLDSGYECLAELNDFEIQDGEIRYHGHIPRQWPRLKKLLLAHLHDHLQDCEIRQLAFHQALHLARLLPYQARRNPARVGLFYGELLLKLNDYLEGRGCA
jgi:hypothetical protein